MDKKHKIEEPFMDYDFSICSLQDCTGLIPARDLSEDEAEHYEELYPYLPPYNEFENNDDGK